MVVNGNSALSGVLDVSTFSSIILPSLTAYPSLSWNTTDLYNSGTISLTAVPEPARGILLLGALAILAMRRRRKWANAV